MPRLLLLLVGLLLELLTSAQSLNIYTSTEITLNSVYLKDSIVVDVHFPENASYTDSAAQFPLIVLFDNYNTVTHQYNLHSIDALSYHAQMPQSVVVGIPFTPQNRAYLTSTTTKTGDSLSGIERMARFLQNELLPVMQGQFQAGKPVILMGHSRTAYLTSYLMLHHTPSWQAIGSYSGFSEEGFTDSDLALWLDTLSLPMAYYFSTGTLQEESTYYNDLSQLASQIDTITHPTFRAAYRWHEHAGHMANYNLSVPWTLMDYYGPFAQVLDQWLFGKGDSLTGVVALKALQDDFSALAPLYDRALYPEPVHLYSIANLYWNKEDLQTALHIFQWGKALYPYDYELDYNIILLLQSLDRSTEADKWQQVTLDALNRDQQTPGSIRKEYYEAIESL